MLKDPNVKSAPVKPSQVKPTDAKPTDARSPQTPSGGIKPAGAKPGRSTVVAKTAAPRTGSRSPAGGRPMDELERRIQQRAYELWENEGRPHGREQDHWQQAEREIMGRGARSAAGAGR